MLPITGSLPCPYNMAPYIRGHIIIKFYKVKLSGYFILNMHAYIIIPEPVPISYSIRIYAAEADL